MYFKNINVKIFSGVTPSGRIITHKIWADCFRTVVLKATRYGLVSFSPGTVRMQHWVLVSDATDPVIWKLHCLVCGAGVLLQPGGQWTRVWAR